MESEISYSYNKPFNSIQNNSGLLRFRSAPSSFLANWDGKNEDQSNFEVSQFVQNMEENKSLNSQYTAQKLDLMRENSTPAPAELFSPFSIQNGYTPMKSVGGYGFPSGEVEFSSPVQSTLGMLSRITEVENETIGLNTPQDRDLPYYGSGLPFNSWNHTTKMGDHLNRLKTELDCEDEKQISHIQGGELRNRPHMLSHHLSIPKASTDFASMDKFLHFQDTV